MIDKERMAVVISDIKQYMNDLDEIGISSKEDLNRKEFYYSASMIAFSVINRMIDLGELVVNGKKLGVPTSYKDIFTLLQKAEYITGNTSKQLGKLVYYRNMLAHEYQEYGAKEVYSILEELSVVESFVETMKAQAKE